MGYCKTLIIYSKDIINNNKLNYYKLKLELRSGQEKILSCAQSEQFASTSLSSGF